MGVSGLVVAQHLCRRAASLQIPLAHGHGAGSNSCTSCELKRLGAIRNVAARTLPSSPASVNPAGVPDGPI